MNAKCALRAVILISMVSTLTVTSDVFAKKVTIKVAHAWPADRFVAQKEFDRKFMERHPDIVVKCENTDWGVYRDKLITRLAAGDIPDVMYTTGCWGQMWISKGIVRDLSPFIKAQKDFNMADFDVTGLTKYKQGNKMFFIPYGWSPMPIYYNIDLFNRYGVEYPAKDAFDLDRLVEVCQKLSKDTNGDGKNDTFGYEHSIAYGWWPLDGIIAPWGTRILAPDEKTMTINDPKAVKAMEFWFDMVKRGLMSNSWGAWCQGKIGMTSTLGSWDVTYINNEVKGKFRWDVGHYFKGPVTRATMAESSGYGITKATKYSKEAWTYLNEYMSTEGQKQMRVAFGAECSRKSARTAKFAGAPENFSRIFEMLDQYALDAIATPLMDYIWPVISREFGAVATGKKGVKQAADIIKNEGDIILKTRKFK